MYHISSFDPTASQRFNPDAKAMGQAADLICIYHFIRVPRYESRQSALARYDAYPFSPFLFEFDVGLAERSRFHYSLFKVATKPRCVSRIACLLMQHSFERPFEEDLPAVTIVGVINAPER
jgi:hypothetical protein